MARKLQEIVDYLDARLKIAEIPDGSCNGLQVEGAPVVTRIGLAVDACLSTYRKAVDRDCQMLIVHHGLIWDGLKSVSGYAGRQVKYLMTNNLSLYGVHLPLDMHPELGNNIQLAKMMKLKGLKPFGAFGGNRTISFQGALPAPVGIRELAEAMRKKVGGKPILVEAGPKKIKRVAIVSGGAGNLLNEAIAAGADCFVTGEPSYSHYHPAREAGINVIYLGHYHSEKCGVQALGRELEKIFGVKTVFLDEPHGEGSF